MKHNYSVLLYAAVALCLASSVQADLITFKASLGPEVQGASGSGSAIVWFDTTAQTMQVKAQFSGLSGVSTVAHIHGATANALSGTAGVMTATPSFPSFPAGVTFGSYDRTFDLKDSSTYNPSFLNNPTIGGSTAAASEALLQALLDQEAYLNVHSQTFSGGEIRGFLQRVPEASITLGLLSFGLAALGGFRRLLHSH